MLKLFLVVGVAAGIAIGVGLALQTDRPSAPIAPAAPPAARPTWERIGASVPPLGAEWYLDKKRDESRQIAIATAERDSWGVQEVHHMMAVAACEVGNGSAAADEAIGVLNPDMRADMVSICRRSGIEFLGLPPTEAPHRFDWEPVPPVLELSAEAKAQSIKRYQAAMRNEDANLEHAASREEKTLVHLVVAQLACLSGEGYAALSETPYFGDRHVQILLMSICVTYGIKLLL